MAPVPKKENLNLNYTSNDQESTQLSGDEVVISGISANFPKSDDLMQFMDNLYGKKEMIDNNWANVNHPNLPKKFGKIKQWESFDANFFKVTYMQAKTLNPVAKQVLENAYCAIFDSGINPVTLNGLRIGVFVGCLFNDGDMKIFDARDRNPFHLTGCSQTMLANRISYWIKSTGSSYTLNGGCASTLLCLELAYNSIRSGECDAAIVGGYSSILNPNHLLNMKSLGLLSSDGITKCFDKTGDGSAESEAITILFLQKSRDAKRIYTEVCHVKGKYFADPDGCFLYARAPNQIEDFLEEFYSEVKVSPDEVDYVEANAAGIAKSDSQELEAIGNFFGRRKPIKVGSIKSHLGYTATSSPASAIIKVCLATQNGILPGNRHKIELQNQIAPANGRVKILTENTPLKKGSYTAINSFSFTGANYHVLLRDHHKSKAVCEENSTVPYLILASGRQEENVNKILDYLEDNPVHIEQIALLRNIFQDNIPGHTGRGYIILDDHHTNGTAILNRHVEYYPGDNRPVWFLYSGMGSQWPQMGSDLMRIPIFAQSIARCQQVLTPLGIDLLQILTNPDESIFDDIINCFVGISAVQIGLTDILKEIGIIPDNIIGHSLGELGCAYADGCLTTEQMMLSTYYRGLVSKETKFIKGAMAAVGLGHNAILKLCPSEIAVACHNSPNSCSISGPAEKVKEFVVKLTDLGIFAKEVQTASIAYHSQYIAEAGPSLLKCMKNVILDPKLRSEKWLCTSVTRNKWDTAKYASAEYFTNNLLNPVYFDETARLIPSNAIVIEIAPHGLLQAIIKQSHSECYHVPLTRRGQNDAVVFLLNAIGKLYEVGLNPKIQTLYPEVDFPVSTETPILSHLVGWEHSEKWPMYNFNFPRKVIVPGRTISVRDHDYSYVTDPAINGETTSSLSSAAILVFVWETLAMYMNRDYKKVSVLFENVKFYYEMKMGHEDILKLNIEIQKGSQYFEVKTSQENLLIASGKIKLNVKIPSVHQESREDIKDRLWVNSQNVYKMLTWKGYSYKSHFQSIRLINFEESQAYIQWNEKWVTFLDGLIQLNAISKEHDGISTPNYINYLAIDTKRHQNMESLVLDDGICYLAKLDNRMDGVTTCGGVTMKFITFVDNQKPVYDFILSNEKGEQLKLDLASNKASMENGVQIKLYSEWTGDFDRLIWTKEAHSDIKHSIKVCFASISMDDVFRAAGHASNEYKYYGMDFSGIDKNGIPVMGVVANGALSKYVLPDENLTWPVPEYWNLEDAATVPLPYLLAYYCLTMKCELIPGNIVFVTGGAGSLGQAVISLCLALHCTVYTTVSNEQKKTFLLKLFPNLEANNIFYSRHETSFDPYILIPEKQKCDIIINCSSGIIRKAAMKLLRLCGVFLDISQFDMKTNQDIGISYFGEPRNYISIRILSLFENNNLDEKKILHRRISDGIAQGIVKPLSRVVYTPAATTRAFRLLSSSGHRGRVLINMAELESTQSNLSIMKRIQCTVDKVQIIASNHCDLVVEHIKHFITRGATKFIIFIRHPVMTDYLKMNLDIWKRKGTIIAVIFDDDTHDSVYEDLFKSALEIGSIQGVFIYLDINNNIKNSVETVKSLDQACRKIDNLRYFVIVTLGFADSIDSTGIEKICAGRNNLGLHVLHANMAKQISNVSIRTLYYALETTRYSNLSSVSIQIELSEKSREPYLQKISSILGITNAINFDKSAPLTNFKVTDVQLEEIKSAIREYANIDQSLSTLRLMSLESIQHIKEKKEKLVSKFDCGMKTFYSYVCDDIYDASEPIVTMATTLAPNIENEEDFDPEDTYLLLIPGFEGHSYIFRNLAENLKLKALTLQLVPDYENDTVESIAKNIRKYLKDKVNINSKFYILGYSFGVLVALELASLLEKEGLLGTVYCLASSPEALRAQLDAHLGKLGIIELQNAIIMNFHQLLFKGDFNELKELLKGIEDWQSKIRLFIMRVKQKFPLSHEYLGCCLDSFYRRILLSYDYEPNFKLNSEVILIKGVPHPEAKTLSKDYGLSDYTSLPIQVFDIESDHALAPYDYEVTNIIHKTLDSNLQAEFKTKSYCDFYYYTM